MKFCFIQKCVNFIKKQKEEYNENIIYVNWKWSEQVKEDSKAYIQSCDIILQTIKEHYDITQNEKDVVSTEEIYENFITNNNDIVRNRKIYPQHFGLSYKSFKEWVKKHDEFKYQFEAKPTNMGEIKENGFCLVKRNVIKCLKAKEQEQEQNECLLSD
jgi:hypothetical protein